MIVPRYEIIYCYAKLLQVLFESLLVTDQLRPLMQIVWSCKKICSRGKLTQAS